MPNFEGIWRSLYRPCLPHVDSAALSLRHLSLRLARYPAASQSFGGRYWRKEGPDEVSEGMWGSSESGRRGRRGHGGTAIAHSSRNGIAIRSTLMIETGFCPGSIWNHVKKKSRCSINKMRFLTNVQFSA